MRRLLILLPAIALLAGCGGAPRPAPVTPPHIATASRVRAHSDIELVSFIQVTVGVTLKASNGSWSGSPTSFTYQWQDCNASGASCSNISAATGQWYTVQGADGGYTIEVVVTAHNAGGSASQSSSPTNVIPGVVTCNLTATTTTFAAKVAALTAGETLCLASGTYSDWAGASWSSPVTITTEPGAAVTMGFQFTSLSSDSNFTIDGGADGGSWSTPNESMSFDGATTTARNITIQNVSFVGNAINLDIDGPANSNITFNHDLFSGSDCMAGGINIHLSYSGTSPSGVTVENSIIEDGSSDGIQSGTAMAIENNYFYNIIEGSGEGDECHTDAVQFVGMTGGQTLIKGNWFVETSDGIGSWNGDTSPGYLVEDNVFDHQLEEGAIALHSDNDSTVEHNTCINSSGGSCLDLEGASGAPSTGTVVKNNIWDATTPSSPYDQNGYTTIATQLDNMVPSSPTGSDFAGSPTFTAGAGLPFMPTSPTRSIAIS